MTTLPDRIHRGTKPSFLAAAGTAVIAALVLIAWPFSFESLWPLSYVVIFFAALVACKAWLLVKAKPASAKTSLGLRRTHAELEARLAERSEELSRARAELEKVRDEMETRVRDRTLSLKALKHAKEEADRANRAKSEFLSRMSHELRTPMNAILGFAQLLEMDDTTPEQRESIAHITRGGRHLLELINEVLDISRIEAGRLSLSPEPVELGEAVGEVIELMRPLAADRDVRLKPPPLDDYYVLSDRQRLKQVLINLVSNAIKYNRLGGSVAISCVKEEGQARIFVHDTGVGIPAERLEQLFTPFERLGAEQSAIEGTGLGLTVAKRLVEAMDGAIGVESVVGQGTTFWLELPLTHSPLVRTELTNGATKPEAADPGDKRTVLYIEDNLSNLRLIERVFLQRPAIELLSARDGAAGLKLTQERLPNLILLDLNLPDIHGAEVLNRLKRDRRCAEIPVVVISADAMNAQKDRLLAAGAAEYLTKPLNIKKFLDVLDRSFDGVIPEGAVISR